MALSAGTRLGPYEILAPLGAGGMGEVYRALDNNLKRQVAIKVLPASVAAPADQISRFQREAEILAALNHPNIAHIHGLEKADGTVALVMELVDGPTLADRIIEGPIPVDEALPMARQIAEALEAAHEQGIVHRDLKPANVKLRDDGMVKVLDFGLAKALEPAAMANASVTMSPTITSPAMTQLGVILGTAAYMSPEQAKGRPADKRSDVWAFGCTLYEMLTGRRAFGGEDISDTLAAVLRGEPDWSAFPSDVPPHVVRTVRRCLEKDRKARIPEIAAVRFMLDDAGAATTTPGLDQAMARRVGRRGWIAAALLGAALLTASGLAAIVYFGQTPADERKIHFSVAMPRGSNLAMDVTAAGPPLAVSPDGRRVALVAFREGTPRIWVRSLDSIAAQELPGTEGAGWPFWDPDSRMLAFFAEGKLKKIDVAGGGLSTLCDAPAPAGGAWSSEGFILFASYGKGLQRVAAAGGVPTAATTLAPGETAHFSPSVLPDGRHFFYRALTPAIGLLYLGSIGSTDRTIVTVPSDASNVMYSAGYLLFLRQATLMAQPFDLARLVLTGEPVPVAEQVTMFGTPARAIFSASQTGVLAFRAGLTPGAQLTWFDRSGQALSTLGEPFRFGGLELSPDGSRVAAGIGDQDPTRPERGIWIIDVESRRRTRFTFDASVSPIWSPTGDRLAFRLDGGAQPGLYVKPSSSSGPDNGQLLVASTPTSSFPTPTSWSPDEQFLIYSAGGGKTSTDLRVLPLFGERKPRPFLQTDFGEAAGRVSPDGRWMAYVSNESGRNEVYVTAFPQPGPKWLVSGSGAVGPRWRRDGKEIFYRALDSMLTAAEVNGQGVDFKVGAIRPLFKVQPTAFVGYDVARDGQRLLVAVPDSSSSSSEPFDVVVNWQKELKQRAPVK